LKKYLGEKNYDTFSQDVSFKLDKTDKLKNGDKVKLSIVSKKVSAHVKNISKTMVVSGLSKSTNFTWKDYLKEHPIQYAGLNGCGLIGCKDAEKNSLNITPNNEGKLSNGDTVTLGFETSYLSELEKKGKFLTGDKTMKVEVKGLKNIDQLQGFDDVKKQMDTIADKRIKAFAISDEQYDGKCVAMYGAVGTSWLSNGLELTVHNIYEVHHTRQGSLFIPSVDETYYEAFDSSALNLKDDKVSMPNNFSATGGFKQYKTQEDALKSIKADHVNAVEIK
jgi:hypothetical protein